MVATKAAILVIRVVALEVSEHEQDWRGVGGVDAEMADPLEIGGGEEVGAFLGDGCVEGGSLVEDRGRLLKDQLACFAE